MEHDRSYPDPAELRTFEQEPMPFHEIITGNLELSDDGYLTAEKEHTRYRFCPTYVTVEKKEGEYENVEDVSFTDIDHIEAWERAIHADIQEDFVCVTEFVEGYNGDFHRFHACWVLESVEIENPKLYN